MNGYGNPLSKVGAYGMAKAGHMEFTQWLAALSGQYRVDTGCSASS